MLKSFIKTGLVFTLFSSLFSCAVSPDVMEVLDSSIRSYERAVRWGEFIRAKSFHKNNPTLTDLERRRLKFYRVTSYATLQNSVQDRNNSYLLVEVKYYKNDRPVVKSLTYKQHWKRDKGSSIWYINTPFPKFR